MIDDVWSGGTSKDGPYPLMSSAIAAGLYHPNCKDSHSTYFPGISTKPDDKFSQDEIEEIKNNYKLEQKKSFAQKQSEKYRSLAKTAMDIKEKERYKHKYKQWKNKTYDVNMLRTYEDPIREVLGSAFESHYKETQTIIRELKQKGIEIEYRENVMGYMPSPTPGRGGKFVIDRNASYSAWLHERQHVLDDEESGWMGFRNFVDPEIAAKMEDKAYDVEIDFAKQLGYNKIVKRLEKLKADRHKGVLGHD